MVSRHFRGRVVRESSELTGRVFVRPPGALAGARLHPPMNLSQWNGLSIAWEGKLCDRAERTRFGDSVVD